MTISSCGPGSVTTLVLVGALGGTVRALVGVLKYMEQSKREQRFHVGYFVCSILISAVIGGFAGAISSGSWKIAGLAGYAGTDFIESLYKIKRSQGLET
ncbi:MAG: hypothetical protein ABR899_03795 [Candidatus Krumholzibacteriaceae bacterium]|jgi:Na+/H+ antiporter NhaC